MSQLLLALGVTLVLGGLGHSAGVMHLYVTRGVPDMNRVLLDVWVAEAHMIGGGLYFAAFRAMRAGAAWKGLSVAGALTILAYAVPFIPVLFVRAPVVFRIPPIVYALLSVFIAWRVARSMGLDHQPYTVDREHVLQLSRALLRAVNESDLAGVTGVWAIDGILMPPHHSSVSGRAAIKEYFVQLFGRGRFAFEFTASAVDVAGDTATERVEYTASFFAASGSAPSFDRGKGLHVFRRQSDGEWRLAMDIWNSDNPTPTARQ